MGNAVIDKEKISKEIVDDVANSRYLDGHLLYKMLHGGAAQLRSKANEVNDLNVFPVPDGDTGDNMSMTIENGVAALDKAAETGDLSEVVETLARGMLLGARGNSGVILSQFFGGIAKGLQFCARADVETVGKALEIGVKQAYDSVLVPTEGTILTVAREAVEYAVGNINSESTIRSLFSDLIKEMYASLQRTPQILAVLREAGVIDSGGAGLFYIVEGFNKVLNGEEVAKASADPSASKGVPSVDYSSFGPDSKMTYGYCTELLLQLLNEKCDTDNFDLSVITDFLQSIGNSVVSVISGTVVKIHVHTLTPEKVLEFCRGYGEFLAVKIENMSVQHSEKMVEEEEKVTEVLAEAVAEDTKKKYGIVSVCTGDGIENLFFELGVDYIVNGGQTQNPSTNDFLVAFEKVNAEHIFVFPNNGNILMAAKQAASIYEGAEVHVVESKDLGAGYVGIASLDLYSENVDEMLEGVKEAISNVKTGYVSIAIRDADMNGVHITNGDFISIVGKEIISSEKERQRSVEKLVDKILDDEKAILTVFVGKDTTSEESDLLKQYVEKKYPDIEVYITDGGQDIYYYICVAE